MSTVAPIKVRTRRNTELALLITALLLAVLAYALVGIGMTDSVPADIAAYGGILAVLAIGTHVVLRFKAPYADPVMLPVTTALTGIGLAMIYRLDFKRAARNEIRVEENKTRPADDQWDMLPLLEPRQLMWTAVGVAAAILVLFLLKDHRTLRKLTYTSLIVGVILLLLPLAIGTVTNGAKIWLKIGPVSIQPAEFAKIALAVFFAGYLVVNRENLTLSGKRIFGIHLPRVRYLVPIMLAWIVSVAVLVFERDLGTSLLFFGLFVAMLYIATQRVSWIIIGLGLFLGGCVIAYNLFSHFQDRVKIWLDPLNSEIYTREYGGSYQVVQGFFGFANGGLLGTGWGEGRPDLVTHSESDFIIAAIGEEVGLTGFLAVIILYLIFVERGFRTALGVRDGFGKLLAGGLSFAIALQCFVVIGGVTGLIPLTGLTLPFVAYGGSSILANWMILALLLRMSDLARRPEDPTGPSAADDAALTPPQEPQGILVGDGHTAQGTPDDSATQVVRLK